MRTPKAVQRAKHFFQRHRGAARAAGCARVDAVAQVDDELHAACVAGARHASTQQHTTYEAEDTTATSSMHLPADAWSPRKRQPLSQCAGFRGSIAVCRALTCRSSRAASERRRRKGTASEARSDASRAPPRRRVRVLRVRQNAEQQERRRLWPAQEVEEAQQKSEREDSNSQEHAHRAAPRPARRVSSS